jgi:small subunit ribosomal protein S16
MEPSGPGSIDIPKAFVYRPALQQTGVIETMSVVLRLARAGAKKMPYYHIVAADRRSPRDGKFIEAIGAYDPNLEPPKFEVNEERWTHWIKVGAQPSETVAGLKKRATKPAAKA